MKRPKKKNVKTQGKKIGKRGGKKTMDAEKKAEDTDIGMNRTGAAASPADSKDVAQFALAADSPAVDEGADDIRAGYVRESGPVGTMPPPAALKGGPQGIAGKAAGQRSGVLLDKLGERLAFERGGTRLYDAMICKLQAVDDAAEGGPTVAQLRRVRDAEMAHFRLVWEAIEELGGDPTAVTPSSDAVGVKNMGFVQAMMDPRTDLAAGAEVLLAAELIDNDGWEALIDLARGLGQDEIASRFTQALEEEAEHLTMARRWVAGLVRAKAGLLPSAEKV